MTLLAQNVSFEVRGRPLLRDVSVSIQPGEVLAVMGPNGAGKSTLLKVLAGELVPSRGCVMQNGRNIADMAAMDLAQERAVMPQAASMVFPFAVRDVVMLGRAPFRKTSPHWLDLRLVDQAMEQADISHLADHPYPALSGGEKQRVHLARALVQLWAVPDNPGPEGQSRHSGLIYRYRNKWAQVRKLPSVHGSQGRFLLLDEPTAGLDIAHQHALLHLARQEARQHNAGILMILHDFNQITRYADKVVLLRKGAVFASGSVADVMQPDLLSELFENPVRAVPDPNGAIPILVGDMAVQTGTVDEAKGSRAAGNAPLPSQSFRAG
ncbi:heme ABC transporter ATP-binding protein [Thalassospira sp. TSL5-1]|uniref:heme ABC transporter ATP-binding protein n=1 Tax=Thalassospira sp. TSL5-1 TaxID=1544451 RepID=UPI00093ADB9E|nr:heme ABC transporter ATP-binding protein [Thalassospira sp. TSL5-1]